MSNQNNNDTWMEKFKNKVAILLAGFGAIMAWLIYRNEK